MKIRNFLLYVLFFMGCSLQAAEVLRVGVDPINPPFVMQGTNTQFYGYDIAMMEYICQDLQRQCVFIPIRFDKIFDAVHSSDVDVAVSSIIITAERARRVNFSLPYLLSNAHFIGSKKFAEQPFGLSLLNEHRIGVTGGSIFPDVIKNLGVKNHVVVYYTNLNDLIEALYHGKVDFGLLDEPSALYWQAQSGHRLALLGKSFNYGIGLGIAVNPDNLTLLQAINKALLKYQESDDFKKNYHIYIPISPEGTEFSLSPFTR